MQMEQRFKIINFLENTFINEALEVFEKKCGRGLTENEQTDVITNWHNYSSSFTRMWLNYLTDDKLVNILNKKLQEEKNQRKFEEIVGYN